MTTQTIIQAVSLNKAFALKLPRVNWKAFIALGFCAVLSLSVLYVFQINRMVQGSYLTKSYQKQINDLIQVNKNLEINLAQISYLENIQNKTQELNFQKVEKIKYVQILGSSLAKI
jgi:hypothetical protein